MKAFGLAFTSLLVGLTITSGPPAAYAQGVHRSTAAAEPIERFEQPGQFRRITPVEPESPFAQAPPPLPPARPPTLAPVENAPPPATPQPPQERQAAPSGPPPIRVSQTQLNMVTTAPERIGQVPNHFFWIRQGLQAVQDPVDGTLVFIVDDGRIAGRAALPSGFAIDEIFPEENEIRLIEGGRRQVIIARNIDPVATTTLPEASPDAHGGERRLQLTRRSPQLLVLNDARRSGARALDVRSIAGGHLAQAYEVSPGTGEFRYIVSEEIAATKPSLQVRVFVQRFDKAGKLTGVAYVPLDGVDAVPRDFIAVTGEGRVRALVPMHDGIKIREIEFSAPLRGRATNVELKSLGRTLREIPVDANITGGSRFPFRSDAPNVELTVATPPIARSKVLENASAYLTVNWVMQPDNFSRPNLENVCDPQRGNFWLRPRRFTEDMIGTTIAAMPYRWGGDDTPGSFRLSIEWGALAGDLCTCRDAALNYCLFRDAVGVDCSGFVSRAWGIDKRGTSGLLDVATEVESIEALKPGDAIDWPQRHVRLFTGMAPGAAIAFNVLESSTRLECEGVCERTLRPSEINGYRLIRYRGISENGVVASNGQNGGAKPNGAAATAPAQSGATAAASVSKVTRRVSVKTRAKLPPRHAVRIVPLTSKRAQRR